MYLINLPIKALRTNKYGLTLINPSTIAIGLPKKGKAEKIPNHAPLPCAIFFACSIFSGFTCRYF